MFMKKTLFSALCTLAISSHINAMLSKPADDDNFHNNLAKSQLAKMICNNRADELKLWLDQSSKKGDLPIFFIANLHAFASRQQAQESADVLLTFMMKIGL